MKKKWDIIIIGAGPAGSISASKLSEAGLKILILDKNKFPREKVCGDGLLTDSIECLKRCGIYKIVEENSSLINKICVYSSSGIKIEIPGKYLSLKREILDNILLEHALGKKADFLNRNIVKIEEHDDFFKCHSKDGETFTSRFGIVATGADTSLIKPYILKERDLNPDAVAVRNYIQSDYITQNIFVSYWHSIIPGYAWIFPLGGGLYNTGCSFFYNNKKKKDNLRKCYNDFLREFPEARKIVSAKINETKLKGGILRCGLKIKFLLNENISNFLCIGETIGTTYPFTGEGVGKAMESGELAAEYILGRIKLGLPLAPREYYTLLYSKLSDKYRGYKIAEKWLSNSFLNNYIAKRVQKSTFLHEIAVGIMNESTDPRKIFSFKGLMKSFLK